MKPSPTAYMLAYIFSHIAFETAIHSLTLHLSLSFFSTECHRHNRLNVRFFVLTRVGSKNYCLWESILRRMLLLTQPSFTKEKLLLSWDLVQAPFHKAARTTTANSTGKLTPASTIQSAIWKTVLHSTLSLN